MFSSCCEAVFGRMRDDRGSAAIEFVTFGVLLTVPMLYLVIALAQLQAGFMAAEAAARNGARIIAVYGDQADATAAAGAALAFSDAGFGDLEHTMTIACSGDDCSQPEGTVAVSVTAHIPLPLVPTFGDAAGASGIPVSATATMPISAYAEEP